MSCQKKQLRIMYVSWIARGADDTIFIDANTSFIQGGRVLAGGIGRKRLHRILKVWPV